MVLKRSHSHKELSSKAAAAVTGHSLTDTASPTSGSFWPWQGWPAEARLLLGLVAIWSLIGLLVLGSASWWVAEREMGDGAFYLKRQLIWMAASWGLLTLGVRNSLRRWLHFAPLAMIGGCLLVAATLVMGSTVNGASRWLVMGPLQLQPSELIKPFVVLQGAALFAHWRRIGLDQKLFGHKFCFMESSNQRGNYMGMFRMKVVSGPIQIGRHHRAKVGAKLPIV